jgi:butyryl-CoA dehydrogenase
MIHEGTHGIQALDLLGRKVTMDGGAGFDLMRSRVFDTVRRARETRLAEDGVRLNVSLERLTEATRAAWSTGDPAEALANATPYMQAFGHVVLAWLWLDLAIAAERAIGRGGDTDFLRGKQQASRYFLDYELPKIDAWLAVAASRNPTCREMRDEWFAT